jgi:hypothetical protein
MRLTAPAAWLRWTLEPAAELAAVEEDIRRELEFHLRSSEELLIAGGMPAAEASAEARRRFGDFDSVLADCRRIRLQRRIMIQRVNTFLLGLLVVAVAFFLMEAWSSRAEHRQAVADLESRLDRIGTLLSEKQDAGDRRDDTGAPVASRRLAETGDDSRGADGPAGQQRALPAPDPEAVLRRFNAAWPLSSALEIAKELASLSGADALRIMQAIHARIENAEVREMVLEPLVRAHPELALRFLHLGASDASEAVRAAALARISDFALFDFAKDPAAYPAWWARHGGLSTSEVMSSCAAEFATRVGTLQGPALVELLARFQWRTFGSTRQLGLDLGGMLRGAGIGNVLDRLVQSPDGDVRKHAWGLVAQVGGLDEAFLRRNAAPLLRAPDELPHEVATAVYTALAAQRSPWACDLLQDAMLATAPTHPASYFAVATALAKAGDPRAIPRMIGMIAADDSPETIYGIGWFGLTKLTGVPYDESHDGKWWLDWWEKNQDRLPAEVRGQPIPKVDLRKPR